MLCCKGVARLRLEVVVIATKKPNSKKPLYKLLYPQLVVQTPRNMFAKMVTRIFKLVKLMLVSIPGIVRAVDSHVRQPYSGIGCCANP